MDSKIVSAYEQIASGHRQLAEYYSSLAASTCPSEVPSAVSSGVDSKASETPKTKKPKDPNAPKRPMSSFLLFANENRAAMKEKHPDLSHTELTRELGLLWKTVDHTPYDERSNALMSQWKLESEDYKKANPSPVTPEKPKRKKKAKAAETSSDEAASPVSESAAIETPKAEATLNVSPKPAKVQASPAKPVAETSSEKVAEPSQDADGQKTKKKKKSKHATETTEPTSTKEAATEIASTQEEPKPKKQKKSKEHAPSQVSVTA